MRITTPKIPKLIPKLTLIVLVVAGALLVESGVWQEPSFAVTGLDHSKVAYTVGTGLKPVSTVVLQREDQESGRGALITDGPDVPAQPQKARAPEPSTMFLLLSGIAGAFLRFVRMSFTKCKRAVDYFLAIAGLTIAAPVLLLMAIMVKLTSKGPVIYRQARVGLNGKIFKIYKLRTMRADAERNTGAVWAKADDDRVTAIGAILRKTHIDEIPQLFNVVKGQMSIVGPRPERPEMVRDLKLTIKDYEKRLRVLPGITGLAQVLHKYDENINDVRKKIKYDLFYIKRMCWLVEMRVFALTFVVALTGKGAR